VYHGGNNSHFDSAELALQGLLIGRLAAHRQLGWRVLTLLGRGLQRQFRSLAISE
jgi:hypothetical protein